MLQKAKKQSPQSRLTELIPNYARHKEDMDELKKYCDKENKEIKMLMEGLEENTFSSCGYTAKRTVSNRETINEDKLLEVAHNEGISEIIKTKEYIDFDALEKAIYDGVIPQDVLLKIGSCREVKEVVTLKVTKAKEDN